MSRRNGRRLVRMRLGSWAWVVALALVAVGASFLGSVPPSPRNASDRPTTTVPVVHRELVCPGTTLPGKTQTRVVVLSARFDGARSGGTVTAGAGRLEPLNLPRGRPVSLPSSAARGAQIVADGPAAQGLVAVRSDSGRTVAGAVACTEPRADWWFSGGGASVSRTSTLFLRNIDPGDASVRLRVFAAGGEITPTTGDSFVLKAGASKRVPLSLLAPFHSDLTVWVHADRGRVAAAMLDRERGKALQSDAIGWLAGTARPSRSVRLAADFAAARSSTVLVTNPGQRESIVSFQVAGRNGWFTPAALKQITLGPGQIASVDVTKVVGRRASAVQVTSDRPVVAAARIKVPGDVAQLEPVSTFDSPTWAIVPPARQATLTLLGARPGATVTVSSLDRRGKVLATRSVTVVSGSAASVKLPKNTTQVEIAPSVGALAAVLTLTGPGIAVLPVQGLVLSVPQAVVVPFHG